MADSSIESILARGKEQFINEGRMNLFDTRLYRRLVMYNEQMKEDNESNNLFYPHFDYGSYVMDFHETPTSVERMIEETNEIDQPKVKQGLQQRKDYIEKFIKTNENKYLASRSFIHPYALVKFAGAHGDPNVVANFLTYDRYNKRRFYEIDGDSTYAGNYSKTPTTTKLIKSSLPLQIKFLTLSIELE